MNTPTLSIYHANSKRTGSALKVALVKPQPIEGVDGFESGRFEFTLASQAENRGSFPSFDWDDGITFRLTFRSAANVLAVFRGIYETIDNGKGLVDSGISGGSVQLRLSHIFEPRAGYKLEISRYGDALDPTTIQIYLTEAEALGLNLAMEASLGEMVFGA